MRVYPRTLLCCAVLALALAAPALAEDPPAKGDQKAAGQSEQQAKEKAAAKKDPKQAAKKAQEKVDKAKKGVDEPIVFTNGDLEALFGKSQPSASPAPAPSGSVARPGVPAAKPGQTDKTKARIQQIQAEIKRLNEMNRSLRNPYLRRVQTTDEEKKVYANKGSDERIRINDERIAALRQELAKLQSAPAAPSAGAKGRSTR